MPTSSPSNRNKDVLLGVVLFVVGCLIGVGVALYVKHHNEKKAAEAARIESLRRDSLERVALEQQAEQAEQERQQAEAALKAQEEQHIISFITEMYNNHRYEDYAFLQRHCTAKMLRQLQDCYDYDCDEGPCYATWIFRTGAQDSNYPDERTGIISVKHIGGSTYEYNYYDGGWRGRSRINVTMVGGVEKIDDVRLIYTDCH